MGFTTKPYSCRLYPDCCRTGPILLTDMGRVWHGVCFISEVSHPHTLYFVSGISLLKNDQQIPSYIDIHFLSKLISMSMDIDMNIHDSSMNVHVYITDIYMDSSTWSIILRTIYSFFFNLKRLTGR